ncbi:MAG: hydrogenase maturation peptidase HycI [Candidatus Omnitrophica bacterium]|nr:hydrogenase maturation peptidase HycI [Candidatus Omnitrophota bacterium]
MSSLNLKKIIREKLKGAKRVALLGVGSELRGDDAAGILAAKQLKKAVKVKQVKFKVFLGETAPENFTGEIKKFNPTHLIIIDTADAGKKAGTLMLINPETVGGISFSTHVMPTKIMVDYLLSSIDCQIIILGVQPKNLAFGDPLSHEVEHAVEDITSALESCLKGL